MFNRPPAARVASALALLASAPAFAQSPPSATPTKEAEAAPPRVEVVDKAIRSFTVTNATTATRTDTPLMDTPFSVQVVPPQVLQDQLVNTLEKALQNVPGVVPFSTNQGLSDGFIIRGFGSNITYRDGFFIPDILGGGSSKGATANIERIEVLKGPGSILFGRTEPGGIINVITKLPLAEQQTSIAQEFGSYSFFRTLVDSTGPLSSDGSVLYRVDMSYETTDSFRDFIKDKGFFIAPALTWNLSPQSQLRARFEYQDFDETPDSGVLPLNGRPADVPISRVYFEPLSNYNNGHRSMLSLGWTQAIDERWTLRANLTGEQFKFDNLTLFPGELLPDGTLDRYFNNGGSQTSKRFSAMTDLTGKFSTGSVQHTLVMGVDYFSIDDALNGLNCCEAAPPFNYFAPTYSSTPQVFDPANDFDLDFKQRWYGVFAQDQIALPGNLNALIGLRYDNAIGRSSGQVTDKDNKVSPRVGLVWRTQPWLSLYGSYTENFGASNSLFNPPDMRLPSQTAQQWEFGAKTELLDKRLSATIAFYQLTKQNLPVDDPSNPNIQIAVGEARTRGVELDVSGDLGAGWQVIGGLAYMPYAQITKDSESDGAGGVTPGYTGNRLYLAPRLQGSVWLAYEVRSEALRGLRLGGGVVGVGQRYGDIDNSYVLPGYGIVNLMAAYSWSWNAQRFTAQLNLDNLFDKVHYTSSNSGSMISVGTPRSAKASLQWSF